MDSATIPDFGRNWFNTWNQPIANVSSGAPILPNSPGITVFSIPKYGFVHVSLLMCTAEHITIEAVSLIKKHR